MTAVNTLPAPRFYEAPPPISIVVRKAICGGVHQQDHTSTDYHDIRDSDITLPDFESRAEGTPASQVCAGCHFTYPAHNIYGILLSGDHEFVEHGAWEFDSFYCGHVLGGN